MKGVILAAGIGSRLSPLTEDKPKCLVDVAGKKILDYQLDSYRNAGIKNIIIVVGYKGYLIEEYCKYIRDLNIEIIYNTDYENTNNMYSLYLAKSKIYNQSFILNNADVAIDIDIISSLVRSSIDNLVAVDIGLYNEESMKISCDNGFISDISKNIPYENAVGCSIDFYKISSIASTLLLDEVSNIIEMGNKKDWTEVALQTIFKKGLVKFEVLGIGNKKWIEIDNLRDLYLADEVFSQIKRKVIDYKLYIFDLDGTIYIGNSPIKDVVNSINYLKNNNKLVKFISNNSSKSKSDYVNRLLELGIHINESDIILSTDSVINFLFEKNIKNIHVLGTNKLRQEFLNKGFILDDNLAELIVVGFDTELTYEKLVKVCNLITQKKLDYIATHKDMFCPTEKGPIPDIGTIIFMLENTTGKKPLKVFGKPDERILYDFMKDFSSISKKDVIMIGDRLYTDILMAKNFGIDSILVLSGDSDRYMVENSNIKPTYILPYFKIN